MVLALIMFLVGAVFLVVGLVATNRSKKAQTWPATPGTILSSEVIRHEDSDSEGGTTVNYEPAVTYQYSIMGQAFTGKRIAYGANRFTYKKATEISTRYPAGAPVSVHYDPDKPSNSTLETVALGGKVFTIIGAVLVAISIIMAILYFVL